METSLIKTNSSHPLVLEFVGLPGAGKTTVFHEVVLLLREQGVTIAARDEILQQWKHQRLWQRLWKLIPQTQNQWRILLHALILASQVKPNNWSSFAKAIKIFANVKRIDAIARQQKHQLILLDQGLLQETWSVGITGTLPSLQDLKQAIALLLHHRPIAIVYFQIDVATAIERIQSRSTAESRFDQMDQKAAHQLLSQYLNYLQEIINCVQTFNIPMLEIDSSLPIDEKAHKILSWMHHINYE